jgi:hypothetical protein
VLVSSVLLLMGVNIPIVRAGTSSNVSVDGSTSNGCGYVTVCSVSLTTSQSNDVVIVGCDCFPYGMAFSVKDSAGLTFLPRDSSLSIGGGQFVETWYAISSSILSADQISVTTADTGETWYGVVAFAVSGANAADPFVAGFPISQANLKCASPCNTGVSAPAGSFVFQVGGDTGSKVQTAGAGMTLIQATRTGQDTYAQYDALSSALSAATLSFGTGQGSDFGVIVDAINPGVSTTSSTSTTTSSSVTNDMEADGSASTGCGYTATCSLSLTTTHSNDLIIVGCNCFPSSSPFSVKDTSGLTFVQRQSPLSIGGNEFVETWYAIAASALSSDMISVTTANTGETWYGIIAFAVSGANTAQPFASGFPLSQANLKCASPCNTGVSAPAGAFVFQVGGDTGSTLQTAGTGMTLIQATKEGQDSYAQYEALSSSLSGATLSFGTAQGSDFGVIVDAINPATTSSSSTSSSSTSSSSTSSSSTSSSSTSSSSTSTANGLAIDGSSTAVGYGVTVATVTATTTIPNDLIILYPSTGEYSSSGCGSVTTPPVITSVTDASGLTWHQRSTGTVTSCETSPGPVDTGYGFEFHEEEWYAVASSPLSQDRITVTAASTAGEIQMVELGISGANTQSPFDPSGSLPCVATGYSVSPACTLTTVSSKTMVIMGDTSLNGVLSNPGYTLVLFSGQNLQDMGAEYQTFASPQSGISVGFSQYGDIASGNDIWLVIGDAVVAAST